MNEQEYYARRRIDSDRRERARKKAANRGRASAKWLESNELTRDTQKEFNALMKKTDRDFEQGKEVTNEY